jgi:hypothetical protein
MKFLIFVVVISLSTSVFSEVSLKGEFPLDEKSYNIIVKYVLNKNQKANNMGVKIFDDLVNPESGEIISSFCMNYMSFPVSNSVTITEKESSKVVFTKKGSEDLIGSVGGSEVINNHCSWILKDWKAKVFSMLRLTETTFMLNGLSYRYFIDTHLLVSAVGSDSDFIFAEDSRSVKNSDGIGNGEVWLDTLPSYNGHFERTYLRLSL